MQKVNEVAQSCPTLCNSMDYSLPGSSLHGILQARVLEWVAIAFSRGSSRPRDRTWVSHIPGRCFNLWATRKPIFMQKFHYNTMKTGTSRRGLLRSILASLVAQQSRICPPMHETSWVGKIPWRKKWLPTPVFLSGEYHVQRILAGYSPWGRRVRRDLVTKQQQGLSFQMGQNRGVVVFLFNLLNYNLKALKDKQAIDPCSIEKASILYNRPQGSTP